MEDAVDTHETAGRASHGIVGGGKTVNDFVPRRGSREEELADDTEQIHPPKGQTPELNRTPRSQ